MDRIKKLGGWLLENFSTLAWLASLVGSFTVPAWAAKMTGALSILRLLGLRLARVE